MKTLATGLLVLLACTAATAVGSDAAPCTDDWYRFVEQKVISGDGQGHGPDPGSDEWKGVVEFKLGIRGQPGIPPRDSEEWCSYIDGLVSKL
jgi:hypothetical protein